MFAVCSKSRLDTFTIFLGINLSNLTRNQHEEVLDILPGI